MYPFVVYAFTDLNVLVKVSRRSTFPMKDENLDTNVYKYEPSQFITTQSQMQSCHKDIRAMTKHIFRLSLHRVVVRLE